MKVARLDAEFSELSGNNRLIAVGEASTVRAAISRGVAVLFKDPALKGKRITTINLTINLSNKTVEAPVDQETAE